MGKHGLKANRYGENTWKDIARKKELRASAAYYVNAIFMQSTVNISSGFPSIDVPPLDTWCVLHFRWPVGAHTRQKKDENKRLLCWHRTGPEPAQAYCGTRPAGIYWHGVVSRWLSWSQTLVYSHAFSLKCKACSIMCVFCAASI